MKIDDMDKYQLTEFIKDLKEVILDPETAIYDVPRDIIEEIINPETDKDGYVHKYYLTDDTKLIAESLSMVIKKSRSL